MAPMTMAMPTTAILKPATTPKSEHHMPLMFPDRSRNSMTSPEATMSPRVTVMMLE